MDSKTEKRFIRLSHGKEYPKDISGLGCFETKSYLKKKKTKEKDIYIYEPLLKTDSNKIKNNVIIMILFVGEKYLSLRFVGF